MNEIMEKLKENGYESYIVGGYVRDYLLGIESKDIDICTNAPISKIMKIFKGRGTAFKEYYSFHIEENGYSYDITSYRKELKYKKNKPIELEYAKDLKTDLLRRDFTINTFAIDYDNKFVDLLGAKRDLDCKLIRTVNDTSKSLNEDKTRILRAIRFSCALDFDLDPEIEKFLSNKNVYLLNEVPNEYKKKELDKIFDSNNIDKFMYLSKKYDLSKYLHISYDKLIHTYNRYGIWAQIETDLPFPNKEKNIINEIKRIVSNGDIFISDIKKFDNEIVLNAASILKMEDKIGILKDIMKLHSVLDMDISINVIASYVKLSDVKKTYKLIEKNIMEGKIENTRESIEYFLKYMDYE